MRAACSIEFAPDVVIGVGGYASGPAMLAAVVKHIPTLAFEPNVVPGFANRMVARFVSGAAVHFEETAKYFRHAEVTGVPVRQAFFEIAPKRGGTPTLLVFGGSQGAHAINEAMIRCLPDLQREAPGIHIIHQTGERDYNDALAAYQNLGRIGRGVQVHRRHAGGLCARRFGGLPVRREHRRGNCGGGKARDVCAISRARPTIISA